MKAELDIQ